MSTKAADIGDDRDRIIDAFMQVIAQHGWSGAQLERVAQVAQRDIVEIVRLIGDRWDALRAYRRRLDLESLAAIEADDEASVRDRLFDLLMARFEAMQAQRPAIERLFRTARRDPGLAAFFAVEMPKSFRRLADAAGVDTGGYFGLLRVKALVMLHLAVMRAWLDDETSDLSHTMTALDERLARAERWARCLPKTSRAGSVADEMPDPAAAI
jgi:ubiquinone biosynthesis protein COQ9